MTRPVTVKVLMLSAMTVLFSSILLGYFYYTRVPSVVGKVENAPSGERKTLGETRETPNATPRLEVRVPASNEVISQPEITVTIPDGAWEPKGYGFNYFPDHVAVLLGFNNTVTWRNKDRVFHTVTGRDGSFNSGEIAPYEIWRHTFDKPGKYEYYCTLHLAIMVGEVIVVQGNSSSPIP